MPMTANGLAKLIEELGELQQVAGKRLAYFTTDEHPDGGKPLGERMIEEMGDVIGAINFYAAVSGMDMDRIIERASRKQRLFEIWHADSCNNEYGVDSSTTHKD